MYCIIKEAQFQMLGIRLGCCLPILLFRLALTAAIAVATLPKEINEKTTNVTASDPSEISMKSISFKVTERKDSVAYSFS